MRGKKGDATGERANFHGFGKHRRKEVANRKKAVQRAKETPLIFWEQQNQEPEGKVAERKGRHPKEGVTVAKHFGTHRSTRSRRKRGRRA